MILFVLLLIMILFLLLLVFMGISFYKSEKEYRELKDWIDKHYKDLKNPYN